MIARYIMWFLIAITSPLALIILLWKIASDSADFLIEIMNIFYE